MKMNLYLLEYSWEIHSVVIVIMLHVEWGLKDLLTRLNLLELISHRLLWFVPFLKVLPYDLPFRRLKCTELFIFYIFFGWRILLQLFFWDSVFFRVGLLICDKQITKNEEVNFNPFLNENFHNYWHEIQACLNWAWGKQR